MSFSNIGNGPDKAHFQQQASPIKKMLCETKDVVQAEIGRHVQGNESYDVVIKSYGSSQKESPEQQLEREALEKFDNSGIRKKEHQYKSVSQNELSKLFARVESGEELTPREIQVLSELANAVQKSEFVINFGDRIVCPEDHAKSIQYDIQNHTAQVAKVKNLGQKKFIGRNDQGEIIVADRQDLRGVYDVLDGSLQNVEQAFGGQQGVLDPDMERERNDVYSAEDLARMERARRESYSNEFKNDINLLNNHYPLSQRVTYDSPGKEDLRLSDDAGIAGAAISSVIKNMDSGEITKLAAKWSQLVFDIAKNAHKNERLSEKKKDYEARLEEYLDQLYTEEIDEKQIKILLEWALFSIRIEHLEDPSSRAGKDV